MDQDQRAGVKSIHLIFVGILAVLTAPVRSKEVFKAVGYDCRGPTNIKVYDAATHCQKKILQYVHSEQLHLVDVKVPVKGLFQ